ncbi:hypothetical protein ACFL2T_04645 [Elusimicrobiota bacterium]
MLEELRNVSQHGDTRGFRRWFADEEMDLIVWFADGGAVEGFQLCYDKTGEEHAFTWKTTGCLTHTAVDQGEELPTDNRTPILTPDGHVPLERVIGDFKRRSVRLDAALAELVLSKLAAFPKA